MEFEQLCQETEHKLLKFEKLCERFQGMTEDANDFRKRKQREREAAIEASKQLLELNRMDDMRRYRENKKLTRYQATLEQEKQQKNDLKFYDYGSNRNQLRKDLTILEKAFLLLEDKSKYFTYHETNELLKMDEKKAFVDRQAQQRAIEESKLKKKMAKEKKMKKNKWKRREFGSKGNKYRDFDSSDDSNDETEQNIKEMEESEAHKLEIAKANQLEEEKLVEMSNKLFKQSEAYFFKRIHNFGSINDPDMYNQWNKELIMNKKKIDLFYQNIQSLPVKRRPLTRLRKYHINKKLKPDTHHKATGKWGDYHDDKGPKGGRWIDPNPKQQYFWFEYDGTCIMKGYGTKRIAPRALLRSIGGTFGHDGNGSDHNGDSSGNEADGNGGNNGNDSDDIDNKNNNMAIDKKSSPDLLRAQHALQKLIWKVYQQSYQMTLTRLHSYISDSNHSLSQYHLSQMLTQDLCTSELSSFFSNDNENENDEIDYSSLSDKSPDVLIIVCPQHKQHIKFGIWSRSLCLYDNLATGSMIPLVYSIKQMEKNDSSKKKWSLIIADTNANMSFIEDSNLGDETGNRTQSNFPCFHPQNENGTKHLTFLYNRVISNVIKSNPNLQIFWIGHVGGCQDIINIVNKEDDLARHTRGIVFLDYWINNITNLVGATDYVKEHFFDGTFERWSIKPLYCLRKNSNDKKVYSRLKQILPIQESSIYCLLGCSENYRYTPIRGQRYYLQWIFARSHLKEKSLHNGNNSIISKKKKLQGISELENDKEREMIDKQIESNLAKQELTNMTEMTSIAQINDVINQEMKELEKQVIDMSNAPIKLKSAKAQANEKANGKENSNENALRGKGKSKENENENGSKAQTVQELIEFNKKLKENSSVAPNVDNFDNVNGSGNGNGNGNGNGIGNMIGKSNVSNVSNVIVNGRKENIYRDMPPMLITGQELREREERRAEEKRRAEMEMRMEEERLKQEALRLQELAKENEKKEKAKSKDKDKKGSKGKGKDSKSSKSSKTSKSGKGKEKGKEKEKSKSKSKDKEKASKSKSKGKEKDTKSKKSKKSK